MWQRVHVEVLKKEKKIGLAVLCGLKPNRNEICLGELDLFLFECVISFLWLKSITRNGTWLGFIVLIEV